IEPGSSPFPQNLEVAIRKKIEHDITVKANANMAKQLTIVKASEGKSKTKK
uniref:Uncharacterized protein n=1 Tax=Callorhinchus milii TaxID=7868 RepID=A0A4W3GX55_CALMI